MFATIEEAEKAAAMLRRFGGWQSDVRPGGDGSNRFGAVLWLDGEAICDWEELADFLLERRADPPEDERRKELLAQAKAHLRSAHRTIPVPEKMFGNQMYSTVAGVIAALDCLLEALP